MTTQHPALIAAEAAMEAAYDWIDSDEQIEEAANHIVATSATPIEWYWDEDAGMGDGVSFRLVKTTSDMQFEMDAIAYRTGTEETRVALEAKWGPRASYFVADESPLTLAVKQGEEIAKLFK